ncbi:MAG: laccase domain-containing protein, partial [Oscillospiraceae bacterium]
MPTAPAWFCDPVRRVAATSHAGWRGTVQEIGAATVKKMIDEFGCRAENIIAGIGPCIGKCCYEVDDPVINGFKKLDYINISDIAEEKSSGKYMLDLVTANKLILIHAGIDPNN